MRKVGMATREELISAVRDRYRSAGRREKSRILDEFVRITGYCRKHGMRLMRSKRAARQSSRLGRRLYNDAVREALTCTFFNRRGQRLTPVVRFDRG
jgi:hypothetical protein